MSKGQQRLRKGIPPSLIEIISDRNTTSYELIEDEEEEEANLFGQRHQSHGHSAPVGQNSEKALPTMGSVTPSFDYVPSVQTSSDELGSQELMNEKSQRKFEEHEEEEQEKASFLRGLLVGLYVVLSLLTSSYMFMSCRSDAQSSFTGLWIWPFLRCFLSGLAYAAIGWLSYLYDTSMQKRLKEAKIRVRHCQTLIASLAANARTRKCWDQTHRTPQQSHQQQHFHSETTEDAALSSDNPQSSRCQLFLTPARQPSDQISQNREIAKTEWDDSKIEEKLSTQNRPTPQKSSSATDSNRRISLTSTASPHTPSEAGSRANSNMSSALITSAKPIPLKRFLSGDMLDSTVHSKSSASPSLTRPIGESFSNATVLCAHISGFSAWSSEREPSQVFVLLESIWDRFDTVAKRMEVLKVETTSSSYMAVTGVPSAQPDHAVRMAKFARQIQKQMADAVKSMERMLGPGTGDLRLRIGLHSGPVTAGILRSERRFQIFGESVNMASDMESAGDRNRIHISSVTADLLKVANKEQWIQKRKDTVTVRTRNKGEVQTYWLVNPAKDQTEHMPNVPRRVLSRDNLQTRGSEGNSDAPPSCPRKEVWEGQDEDFMLALPQSRREKMTRLIDWVVELFANQLRFVKAQRDVLGISATDFSPDMQGNSTQNSTVLLDNVTEAIKMKQFDPVAQSVILRDTCETELNPMVISQLRGMVTRVAFKYREENPFHSFEHACHVTMSTQKLLRCIVTPNEAEYHDVDVISDDPNYFIFGLTSDAVSQLALLFAALIHNIGDSGVENDVLAREDQRLAKKYKGRCIVEQRAFDVAWNILMKPEMKELQQSFFANEVELMRFRQIVINAVLAIDLDDLKSNEFREQRWTDAFHKCQSDDSYTANLKATAVIELLMQSASNSHSMQHWKVFQRWNERLFREYFLAYDTGRISQDPSRGWYEHILQWFDDQMIPLAKKLQESGIFGVSSDECLDYVIANRREWHRRGYEIVEEMVQRYYKRKNMEVGGLTNEEIASFTSNELEYIIKKLVEKGRNNGTKNVDSVKGQNNAAQAWMDALEIYERAPAASEISDRSIIFPVYSGVHAWLKGGKIPKEVVGNFEQNLAQKFVRESKLHDVGSIHTMRALAMLCEVTARAGYYERALQSLELIRYDPSKHSLKIDKIYGTDRVAQAFAQSATWYDQLGEHEMALQTCDNAIATLLPHLDPTNTLGMFEFLMPILRVLKAYGQAERCCLLFSQYVDQAFRKYHGDNESTPTKSLHKPMLWMFEMCYNPDGFEEFETAVEWLADGDNGIPNDFLDNHIVQNTWAPSGMTAELCLHIARRLQREDRDDVDVLKTIVEKGLRLARLADSKIKNADGSVRLEIANGMNEPVLIELEKLTLLLAIDIHEADVVEEQRCLDVKLPASYVIAPETVSPSFYMPMDGP